MYILFLLAIILLVLSATVSGLLLVQDMYKPGALVWLGDQKIALGVVIAHQVLALLLVAIGLVSYGQKSKSKSKSKSR